MKTLIERAENYLSELIVEKLDDSVFNLLSEEEKVKVKRMIAEGYTIWHVKFDDDMQIVDASSIQEILDKMEGNEKFNSAKSISFSKMR